MEARLYNLFRSRGHENRRDPAESARGRNACRHWLALALEPPS